MRQARPKVKQGSDIMATDPDRHREKMQKIKAARDRMMAGKSGEKGLVIVHTGAGKGKSSSGFGMILRSVAHGMPCAVVQFIKGGWDTGERRLLTQHFGHLCQFHAMGEGFTWETQDRERDIAAARAGWDKARELIRDPQIRMVLLDEINIALRYDYLPIDEVLDFLREEKPPLTHVVLTGRNAKPELIELADLVTEMTLVKHPFRAGIKAQAGVEF
jgi:cob(I)alamin adenosyltransferase